MLQAWGAHSSAPRARTGDDSSSTTANAGSATGYIPESVWNEDSAGNGFSAGGGGVSSFFSKPAWQVETGAAGMTTLVAPDASRDVPDIALDAAAGGSDIPYLYCAGGFCTSGFRNSTSNLDVAGGTSFDSQIFGGMLALVEQKIGSRIGNANQTIYALGNNSAFYNTTSLSVFHDVTSGNNGNPYTRRTPANCPTAGPGYSAGTDYDPGNRLGQRRPQQPCHRLEVGDSAGPWIERGGDFGNRARRLRPAPSLAPT